MNFNKTLEIGINLFGLLTDKPQRVQDLAPMLNTTELSLEQITRKLRKAGLVRVVRGPGGGVYKNTDQQPTVLKIMTTLETYNKKYKTAPNTSFDSVKTKVSEYLASLTI